MTVKPGDLACAKSGPLQVSPGHGLSSSWRWSEHGEVFTVVAVTMEPEPFAALVLDGRARLGWVLVRYLAPVTGDTT